MIKQIKPNSLSHKFLSLIFEEYEVERGINICDVPSCKGSYRVPLKLSSNGALPTKLKDTKLWMKGAVNEYPVRPPPPPAPPKKPCKDCYTCKCGER